MTTRLTVFRPKSATFLGRSLVITAAVAMLCLGACNTTEKTKSTSTGSTASNSTSTSSSTSRSSSSNHSSSRTDSGLDTLSDFDERFGIGPLRAQKLNYHIDWRVDTGAPESKLVAAQNDSVYVLDSTNYLSRYRASDGARIWNAPVASAVEQILAVTDVPETERVYVMTSGALLEVDRNSGGQVGRQNFEKIPNTAPALVGQFLVYGARNGQVVWHSYPVEFQWRATQVAQSIEVKPTYADGYIAVVGNGGQLMTLDADAARMVWRTDLLDKAVSSPAVGGGILYVSSLDQHLRAYDVRNGRLLWKVLTVSQLNTSPTLLDSFVYQQVPGEGLVCFDALPIDSPGGKEIWTAKDVTGSIITRASRNLITWDPESRTMQILDATYGSLVDSFTMSNVRNLFATDIENGVIYAMTESGTLTRVAPAK